MDAMEILRVASFSFIPLLKREMNNFLFGEICKHYKLGNQDIGFSSICILGNLAGHISANSENLGLIDHIFMEA